MPAGSSNWARPQRSQQGCNGGSNGTHTEYERTRQAKNGSRGRELGRNVRDMRIPGSDGGAGGHDALVGMKWSHWEVANAGEIGVGCWLRTRLFLAWAMVRPVSDNGSLPWRILRRQLT